MHSDYILGMYLVLELNQGNNGWSDWVIIRSINIVNDGEWHHAVGVIDRDKSELRFYLDGISQGELLISQM